MPREFDRTFIKQTGDDLEDIVVTMQRTATLDIWTMLTKATPVDTGRARASWIATVGKPSSKVPEADGDSYALERPIGLAKTKMGVPNFIVSNLVYMTRLNEGHSLQAPALFIERAVAKGWRNARKSVRRIARSNGF